MQMRTVVVASAAAVLAVGAAQSAAPPLPPAVVKAVMQAVAICTEAGGKADTSRAIQRGDLNGDGAADYVLDVGAINCDGAPSIYGDREKGVLVFAGDGKGDAIEAFNDFAYGVQIEGDGQNAKVWLTVSGSACGMPPAQDFASESFCNRPLTWNGTSRKFGFGPVSTVRMIQ